MWMSAVPEGETAQQSIDVQRACGLGYRLVPKIGSYFGSIVITILVS